MVLLLEDQPLIAMDTEAMLKQAGFRQIAVRTSVEEAQQTLAEVHPDVVMMEIRLQGHSTAALARGFRQGGIPFLIYTGATQRLVRDHGFPDVEWLSKPADIGVITAALSRVLTGR